MTASPRRPRRRPKTRPQSREQAALFEEAAAKAREEAVRYKGEAIDLDKGKRLVESDLAAA